MVIALPFAGVMGPWLNDEPPDAWRSCARQVHAETPSVLVARLVVEGGAGPDPLIFAADRLADAGFDLLELAPSPALAAAAPQMLKALRLAWRRPLLYKLPFSTDDGPIDDEAVERLSALAECGIAMVSMDVGNGDADSFGRAAAVRAAVGLPMMLYCTGLGQQAAFGAVAAGQADVVALAG
ncbi:MAG: hypothetical protein WD645_00860 [Dehalococcoidia bacterium]